MLDDQEPSRQRWRRWQTWAAGILVVLAVSIGVLLAGGGSPRRNRRSEPTPSATPTQTVTPTGPRPKPTTPASPGPPAQPAPTAEQFGANVNRLFNDRTSTPRQIDAQLAALRETGATIARSDALWEAAEPNPPTDGVHHYDWTFADAIAGSLAAHGLKWIPIVDYSASWAQSLSDTDHSAPRSAEDYAAYGSALAARYGLRGSFWSAHTNLTAEPVDTYEIWNEPDNPVFWSPSPDASGYAELYLRARDAITTIDPSARVIVGGLTNVASFLPALLAARPDLRGHIDGVAIHPYGPGPTGVLARVRTARRTLRKLGLGSVPLYISELGWTTHPAGALSWLPEQLRPSAIDRTIAALGHVDCGIAATVLYTWVTPERNPANREDWFGIHPPSGGSNLDTAAFTEGLQQATRAGPSLRLCGGS